MSDYDRSNLPHRSPELNPWLGSDGRYNWKGFFQRPENEPSGLRLSASVTEFLDQGSYKITSQLLVIRDVHDGYAANHHENGYFVAKLQDRKPSSKTTTVSEALRDAMQRWLEEQEKTKNFIPIVN